MVDEPTFRALTRAMPELGRVLLKMGAKKYKKHFGHEIVRNAVMSLMLNGFEHVMGIRRLYIRDELPHRVNGPAIISGTTSNPYIRAWYVNGMFGVPRNVPPFAPCFICMDMLATIMIRSIKDESGERYEWCTVSTGTLLTRTGLKTEDENPFTNDRFLEIVQIMSWSACESPTIVIDTDPDM